MAIYIIIYIPTNTIGAINNVHNINGNIFFFLLKETKYIIVDIATEHNIVNSNMFFPFGNF